MLSRSKMIHEVKGTGKHDEKLDEKHDETFDKEIQSEEEILPFHITYLTPALIEEARRDLNETDEVREKALKEMRELIKSEKNLVSPTDDIFLLSFLRARKFSIKRAFKLLQNYWKFRMEFKDIFGNINTKTVIELINRNYLGYLFHRDRNGCIVMIFKVCQWNPEIDSFEDLFRAVTAILIHSVEYPATQVAGLRSIFDIRDMSWTQLKYWTVSNIILLIRSTQFTFPMRYKGIHILSESKLFKTAWAMMNPFLPSKLRKRIFIHGNDLKSLEEFIHPSVLPDEYGGHGGPFENSKWADVIEKNTDKVMNFLNYGYKE